MQRTCFDGTMPIDKHFARQKDATYRFWCDASPVKIKSPPRRGRLERLANFTLKDGHLNKTTAQVCVAPASTGICQSPSILPVKGMLLIALVRRIAL